MFCARKAAFVLLAMVLKAPRSSWELLGAALLLGIAGYAWQGSPAQRGAPRTGRPRHALPPLQHLTVRPGPPPCGSRAFAAALRHFGRQRPPRRRRLTTRETPSPQGEEQTLSPCFNG